MKRGVALLLTVMLAGFIRVGAAPAQTGSFLQDWEISGENTARYEKYDYWGDKGGSPYQYTGGEFYNELNTTFGRRYSPYDTFQGRASLLYNDSDYRSQHRGFVLERFNLTWEKGDVSVPFRAQGGDIFSFLSLRTIQRSLKGAQLEIQPRSGSEQRTHSLIFFSGTGVDDYRDFTPANNLFSGASWRTEDRRWGNYSLNLVQNHQASDGTNNLPARSQVATSLTGEKIFGFSGQKVTLEGEVDYFSGDYLSGAATKENRSSMGYFGQLAGETGTPFTYRFRVEDYGKDFRPAGSSVNQDYQAYEAHGAWRFKGGLNLRGRAQHFVDGVNSGNPTKTSVGGINLAGPFSVKALPGLTTSLDAFLQEAKNRDNSLNNRVSSVNLSLSMPVKGWAARLSLAGRHTEDYSSTGNPTQRSYDTTLNATHGIALGGFKGSITPGVVYQKAGGNGTDGDNYGVSLALQLVRNPHQVGFDGRFLAKKVYTPGTINDLTNNVGINYRYTAGPHIVGVELNYNDRDPSPGASTEAYKVAFFYTFQFGKPAGMPVSDAVRSLVAAPPAPSAEKEPAATAKAGPSFVGEDLTGVVERLAKEGITGGVMQPGLVVYEARLFGEIDQRQRFALLHDGKRVTGTVLTVEFDDVGDQRTVSQTYQRVLAAVLKRLGAPSETFEQGQFSPDFVRDVNAGKFIRVSEWKTATGLIRFGIPQRLDRQVRMELQYAVKFPTIRDTFWSVEDLR
jgi:hypothetical protein